MPFNVSHTGIWYSPGVKANVIFFDKKEGRPDPWTDKLWVYDLRTNKHFTQKQAAITRRDFDEFVACYQPGAMHKRKPTWSEENPDGRWRCYTYDEILKRDKLSLDLFWIKDQSLTDTTRYRHHKFSPPKSQMSWKPRSTCSPKSPRS